MDGGLGTSYYFYNACEHNCGFGEGIWSDCETEYLWNEQDRVCGFKYVFEMSIRNHLSSNTTPPEEVNRSSDKSKPH